MTQEERLNTIIGIPNAAFYYLGQVEMWKQTLTVDLKTLEVHSETSQDLVTRDYQLVNIYSEKFCKAMGWI